MMANAPIPIHRQKPKNEYTKRKRITIGQRTSLVFHVNEQATILHLHFSIPIKQIVKVASLTYSLQRRWRLGTSSINTRFIDTYPISSSEWPWLTDLCTRYGDADPLIDKHTVTILGPNVNAVITGGELSSLPDRQLRNLGKSHFSEGQRSLPDRQLRNDARTEKG